MSRALNDLSPRMRPLAVELLARCVEQGIMVMIVDTLRTPAEQQAYVAKGVSWTLHSKHLTGDAIDICPYETYALAGPDKLRWPADDPVWQRIGQIGQAVGLKWGVIKRGMRIDLGHFEFIG
jgi:peptidoglycan L-alanyl-D-glutamate endopeptidase CwlK